MFSESHLNTALCDISDDFNNRLKKNIKFLLCLIVLSAPPFLVSLHFLGHGQLLEVDLLMQG